MKKLAIVLAVFATMMAKMSIAQNVNVSVSGSAMYSSKNASVGTGLVFSEDPAVISQLNVNITSGKWGMLASFSGYTGLQRLSIGDQYHLLDVFGTYQINEEFTLYVGPEFTYKDLDESEDVFGAGLIAMMTWNREKISSTLIYYTDPRFSIHYVIGSIDYRIIDNFSAYGLFGYTTAEQTPVYGMLGMKYSKNEFFAGVYYTFRENAPGPHFNVGFKF
jgi:opacity protein-like surface antigen